MAYIKELTDDKVIAMASLGYTTAGKRITKTKTFRRPKNISKSRWLKSTHLTTVTEWEKELRSTAGPKEEIKLDAFVDLWEKEHGKIHLREETLKSYNDQLNRIILPALGHQYLKNLTPVAIQKIINNLVSDGKARRTVRYPLQVLSSVLSQAVKWGYLENNPCSKVEIPPIAKVEKRKHYEKEEIEKLISLVHDEQLKYQAIFFLALSGGLRKSEILNLTYDDVDKNGVHIRKGKNDSSVRFVTLDESTMRILRLHLVEQKFLREQLLWKDTWLFTQENGSQMYRNTPTQWLKKLCERNNIHWAGLHGLRHTSATLLISSGVDLKTVSSRIGHNQTSTTINIYAHALKEKEEEASKVIGDILHQDEKSSILVAFSEEKSKNKRIG